MARRPIISGNWKMNLNHFEAIATVQKLYWSLKPDDFRAIEVVVHPPFTDIRSVQTVLEADSMPIELGAQNCHWDDVGPFTGEISPSFLSKLNVAYVIVGHSERRREFGETYDMIAKKTAAVLKNGMTPIVCVGETLEDREAQRAHEVVVNELNDALSKVKKDEVKKIVIAYEPAWAINAKVPASPDDAQAMIKLIRTRLAEGWGQETADAVRIQYGGSVDAGTTAGFMSQPDIDGLLVGRASLDPENFGRIINAAKG